MSPEEFYRRLHLGNPGDLEFYQRVTHDAKRVIELGCGWGRLLGPLSVSVSEAWGIEINPEFCAEAREARGESKVQVITGDLRELEALELPKASFDRVIIPYNTLYALGGSAAVGRCLQQAALLLTRNGELWADVYPMDAYQAAAATEEMPEDDDEPVALWTVNGRTVLVLERSSINHRSQHLDVTYLAQDDEQKEIARSQISHDYLLLPQLSGLLNQAGLELEMVLGGFDGRPYDDEADQLIIGAKRVEGLERTTT